MGTLSSGGARWRGLGAGGGAHFSGQPADAADDDESPQRAVWDGRDYIGSAAYFGLAHDDDPAPGADTLAAAWGEHGYLARIAAVSEYTRRKVLFTEIGYRGTHGTAAHPNIWNGNQVTDLAAQASAYEAFYRAVSQQPWMAGFYWWEVGVGSWWVQDYNPIGKDAERVLIDWNARLAAAPPEPPPAEAPADSPAAP